MNKKEVLDGMSIGELQRRTEKKGSGIVDGIR